MAQKIKIYQALAVLIIMISELLFFSLDFY